MVKKEDDQLSSDKTVLKKLMYKIKDIIPSKSENDEPASKTGDHFKYSDLEPRTAEDKLKRAIEKYNASNEQRLVAEINLSAEFDNAYEKLLPEYNAYKNPNFKDLTFTPVSEDTISSSYKGKPFQIRFKHLDNGNKQQDISFDDGSQIKYILFVKDGNMKIYGEEFEMPAGTIIETKSVNDRVFSQLIQTPNMQRKVINKPEYLDKAEEILKTYIPESPDKSESVTETDEPPQPPKPAILPTRKYILDLLGNANSAIPLLYLSKNTSLNTSRTPADEINYLERSIAEGKLPQNTSITGVKEDGGKILTIPGDNCKYEVCGSEMRVIDNSGETKIIARYEKGHESDGLWIVSYDDGKPVSGSRYASWNLDKPLSTVNYAYNNDDTVIVTKIDAKGNNSTIKQVLPKDLCLDIDKELKFVSSDKSHLGSIFEKQTPFIKS